MYCPICKVEQLLLIDDMAGNVDGRCPKCSGRWLGFSEAVSLGFVINSEIQANSLSVANCPRCLGKSLVYTAAAILVSIRPLKCLQCDGVWVNEDLVLKVKHKAVINPNSVIDNSNIDAQIEELLHLNSSAVVIDKRINNPAVEFLAVPIAAIIVWLLSKVGLFVFLQDVLVGMPAHELGHAIALWLIGKFAVPIPFLTLPISDTNILAYLLSLSIIVFLIWKGYQQRLFFWVFIGAIGLYFMLVKGIFNTDAGRSMWVSYSGVGGEFVLGTLGVIAFFYTINRKPNWNLIRYAVMFFGMFICLPAWLSWLDIAAGIEPFPLGSLLYGKEEGDMNTLIELGMTTETIIESYLALGRGCFAVIAVHLAAGGIKAYKFLSANNKK
jgi:Zn-finger nucleic acid-binding protein